MYTCECFWCCCCCMHACMSDVWHIICVYTREKWNEEKKNNMNTAILICIEFFAMVCVREFFLHFNKIITKANTQNYFAVDMFFSVFRFDMCMCLNDWFITILIFCVCVCGVYIDDALHFIKIACEVLFIFIYLLYSPAPALSNTPILYIIFRILVGFCFSVNKWMGQIYTI